MRAVVGRELRVAEPVEGIRDSPGLVFGEVSIDDVALLLKRDAGSLLPLALLLLTTLRLVAAGEASLVAPALLAEAMVPVGLVSLDSRLVGFVGVVWDMVSLGDVLYMLGAARCDVGLHR